MRHELTSGRTARIMRLARMFYRPSFGSISRVLAGQKRLAIGPTLLEPARGDQH